MPDERSLILHQCQLMLVLASFYGPILTQYIVTH